MNNTSRFALLSVSDKRNLTDLAAALVASGFQILSTGGTAALLREHGFDVIEVSDHTGAAEMMAGRVKTLHPTIHGGILGRRGRDDAVMQERGIAPIDCVVVNLYPFAETVTRPDVTFDDAIENIDIGGPAMVRAAAKNHADVLVVTDPQDYPKVIESLGSSDEERAKLRFDLAVKAFEHTARYDGMIANYFGRYIDAGAAAEPSNFSRTFNTQFELKGELRYGENPHQKAAFYEDISAAQGTLARSPIRQGKALSYNNVVDADAALGCVSQFTQCACVIVKHANPCGVAVGESSLDAYEAAYRTDPTSAFGGIIAFNQPLDEAVAKAIVERQFVEVIVAPGISDSALKVLAEFPNVRVLDCAGFEMPVDTQVMKQISGGLLLQDDDLKVVKPSDLKVVSKRQPSEQEFVDLLFAWRVAKYVKSNAIVFCKNGCTIGVGAGQMSRVYSAKIAGIKAADEGLEVTGSVMASDAFFPFRDGIDSAAEAGIAAVIQPGGSRNDPEVIQAADEHDMAMVFTSIRHFRH